MKASHYTSIAVAIAAAIACGKAAQKPAEEPKLEPANSSLPNAAASEEEATPEASASASAGPAASAKPADDKPRTQSGRPVPIYQNPTAPTTIGSDGAVIRFAGGVELRIPSGAMRDARNFLVSEDRRARGTKGKIGTIYTIEIGVPNQEYIPGQQKASEPYTSASGDPFVLKLPLPAGIQSANLACETVSKDAKTKAFTSTWTVVGMTKRESASPDRAVFELTALPDGHVHLTSEAPTAPAQPSK